MSLWAKWGGVIIQMKTSWAVLSQDAICILKWLWSLLGVGERANKLRLKFDELSTIQIRTSSESALAGCDDSALLTKFARSFIYPFLIAPWLFLVVIRIFPEVCTGFQIHPQPHPSISTLVNDSISVSRECVGYHCWCGNLSRYFFLLESLLENARTSPSNNQEAFFRVPE